MLDLHVNIVGCTRLSQAVIVLFLYCQYVLMASKTVMGKESNVFKVTEGLCQCKSNSSV